MFLRKWINRLFLLFLLITVSCQSLPEIDHSAVQVWKQSHAPDRYISPDLHFAALVVNDFPWYRYKLEGWDNSAKMLSTAFKTWYHIPEENIHYLKDPSPGALTDFFKKLASLPKDSSLVFYLGTHHDKDYYLQMPGKRKLHIKEFIKNAKAFPQTLLLSDVCYSQKLEEVITLPENLTILHSSITTDPAVEIKFDNSQISMSKYFNVSKSIISEDLKVKDNKFSLFGFLIVHSLIQMMQEKIPSINTGILFNRIRLESKKLSQQFSSYPVPRLALSNKQELIIAQLAEKGLIKAGKFNPDFEKYFAEMKTLLRKKENEINFEEALLLISKLYDPELDIGKYRKIFDDWAKELSGKLTKSRIQNIKIFNDFIFDKQKIINIKEPYDEDFLVHKIIDSKKGRCSSITALYLILAERLKIPFLSACIPEHIFIRYITDVLYLNVEGTQKGKLLKNEDYRKMTKWKETEKAKTFYLKTLTKKQTIATYLSPLGDVFRKKGSLDQSLRLLRLSLSINKCDAEAWNNLGIVYTLQKNSDMAAITYRTALEINPEFAEVWYNLGNLNSNLEQKLKLYQQAVKLKPELAASWEKLSFVYSQKKNYEMAWTCVLRCQKLNYPLNPAYVKNLKKLLK
ncbi:MAG: tetratricopeptide repeat protein [Lentisphaeria bacterium]|nr:tetratricopeptide repeat protein [Lentisphaeria bacterium]NQZ68070.1 tetratricopeptide repeat protein [Lentisphaeria bacterium]